MCCFYLQREKFGSKTFVAKRFLPRGGTEIQGVTETEVNCTYFWTPLMEVDFTVGVVVPVSHSKDQLKPLQMPNGKIIRPMSEGVALSLIDYFNLLNYSRILSQMSLGVSHLVENIQRKSSMQPWPVIDCVAFPGCPSSIHQLMLKIMFMFFVTKSHWRSWVDSIGP